MLIFASSDTHNVGDLSDMKLAERQHKILNLIKESPTITGKKMTEWHSEHTVHYHSLLADFAKIMSAKLYDIPASDTSADCTEYHQHEYVDEPVTYIGFVCSAEIRDRRGENFQFFKNAAARQVNLLLLC